jgi:hypothetical protein
MSEFKIINNNKHLIVCFGGMGLQFGGILPFEFLKHLSQTFKDDCDMLFYIDKHQCWYHSGIENITTNIDETIDYLNNIISNKYEKVIFIGTSAGGYASILFGSLCNHVSNVIAFIPQTKLLMPKDVKYGDVKQFMNTNVNYILHGDTAINNPNDNHHISHCDHLKDCQNVKIVKHNLLVLKKLRDNGTIKEIVMNCFNK